MNLQKENLIRFNHYNRHKKEKRNSLFKAVILKAGTVRIFALKKRLIKSLLIKWWRIGDSNS